MATALPPEIWRLSWNHALPRDLRSLCLSCRLFRDICQPLLFRHLSFTPPLWEEISAHNFKKMVKTATRSRDRLHSIVSSSHIPPMIHSWAFHFSPDFFVETTLHLDPEEHSGLEAIKAVIHAIHAELTSTLAVCINLSHLTIAGVPISADFCQALSSLGRLAVMRLDSCDIVCPGSIAGISLQEFAFAHPTMEWDEDIAERYKLISTSKLAQLDLVDPVPARVFLTVFTASGPLPCLVSLSLCLSYEAKDIFYRFLDCCPELKCIELIAPITFAGVTLPATSIPALASFRGRIELAGVFTGGRPVRHMTLESIPEMEGDDMQHMYDILEAPPPVDLAIMHAALLQISTCSDTLEDLALPLVSLESSTFRLISELFPELKRLRFHVKDTEELASYPDEGSDGEWETVDGGTSQVGFGDEVTDDIMDVEGDEEDDDEEAGGLDNGWISFSELQKAFNIPSQQLEDPEVAVADEGDYEHRHEDCLSDSEASDPGSISWPEEETAGKSYDDLQLDSLKDFVFSFADDRTPLPRKIRCLVISQIPRAPHEKSVPNDELVSVVESLGARYLGLNKVTIGFNQRPWRRKNGVWKQPKKATHCFFGGGLPMDIMNLLPL
ncbi:hypothetical protein C8R46DRAFT_1093398 [Mycena filopes]|nr:hypothetical protein C8R46DRAFT_1093398 [Mycena filopes]